MNAHSKALFLSTLARPTLEKYAHSLISVKILHEFVWNISRTFYKGDTMSRQCEKDPAAVTEALRSRDISDINQFTAATPAQIASRETASDLMLLTHGLENVLLKVKACTAENIATDGPAITEMLRTELTRLDQTRMSVIVALKYGHNIAQKVKTHSAGIDEDTLKAIKKALKEEDKARDPTPRKRPYRDDSKNIFPCHTCGRVGHWRGDPQCPGAFTRARDDNNGLELHRRAANYQRDQGFQRDHSFQQDHSYPPPGYDGRNFPSFPALTYKKY